MTHLSTFLKKLWNYAFGSKFRKGASLLTILTLGSYALGLVRDMTFSRAFGADKLLDVYNAAFIIPDLLLNVFVAGALTAAFVPVFTHLLSTDEEREAEKVATTMLVAAPLAMLILSIGIFIAMPWLTHIIAPGFEGEQKELLIRMSRLMLISPMLFALSNTLGAMLVSYEQFVGYGLSPILYNIGIIAGIPLTKVFGPEGLVIGVIIGAALHLASRLIAIARSKFRTNFPVEFRNANFKKILKLMIPRMAGQPIEQLTFAIFSSMASTIFVGAVTMLSFARNFQSVPVSIFGISFATAVFASLSRKAALQNRDGFMYHFWETAKPLALLSLASAVFFFFFGKFVVGIFLGGGKFTPEQVEQTGQVLAMFAFAIPAECFIHLLARAFYALKDTWTPLLVTLPGLGLIWLASKLLIPVFSLSALPIAFAAVLSVEVVILFLLLLRKLKKLA